MHELINIAGQIADMLQSLGLDRLAPQAGIGGAMEVFETVDMAEKVKFTLIFAASIAALFGIGLAMAAQKFSVKIEMRRSL